MEIATFHRNVVCCFANRHTKTFKLPPVNSSTIFHSQNDRLWPINTKSRSQRQHRIQPSVKHTLNAL